MNEDQFIEWLEGKTRKHSDWVHGLKMGDDGAVVRLGTGKDLVTSSDSLVEGVHFEVSKISPADLGWKCLAVNLSDIAAMGATPRASLLNISVPKKYMGSWIKSFMKGYLELSEKYQVALVGGDTTASKDKIFISVTAMGEVKKHKEKLRTQARAGDVVCVTGRLGSARAGLDLQNKKWTSPHSRKLIKALHHPEPRVDYGVWLGSRSEVTAMMDISDGLLKDLSRLCRVNQLSVQIDPPKIPVSTAMSAYCEKYDKSKVKEALIGGEDYELLFTCKSNSLEKLSKLFKAHFKSKFSVIGVLCVGEKKNFISWVDAKSYPDIDLKQSFEHF